MEQSYGQEVEHLNVQIGVKQMATKHVFLERIWECWHVAIRLIGMAITYGNDHGTQ